MKNKILLSTLLVFGFASHANEVTITAASSPTTISAKTIEVAKVYFDLIIASISYTNSITNDRAALLKLCAIASALLKDALKFAKQEAKTEEVHEGIYEFEQETVPKIKGFLTFLRAVISSPDVSDEELREMIKAHIKDAPQLIRAFLQD